MMTFSKLKRPAVLYSVLAAAVILILPGASFFYESTAGESCARCHEIRPQFDVWRASSHRSVNCKACHGDALTVDVSFHLTNLRRLITHWRGDVPEQIHLRREDADKLMERCKSCHRQEFAQWQAGPHSITYKEIFLDKEQNRKQLLMDDCLRCHGMFFQGGIRDLVTPVSTKGPWQLKDPALADRPVIPCLACHAMHREGPALAKPRQKPVNPGPGQEIVRPSLAMFDRRESGHMPVVRLPIPAVLEGSRAVKLSPDQRQGLCYQCHAPLAARQVGSGDDRTPVGVHEGISCLACHQKHRQTTRASCAECHPRLSNCGIDVEKMDTTFVSTKSKHNVHFVKCIDCHPKGVPKRKQPGPAVTQRAD